MKCQPSGLNTAQFDLGWLFFSKGDGVHQLDKPLCCVCCRRFPLVVAMRMTLHFLDRGSLESFINH